MDAPPSVPELSAAANTTSHSPTAAVTLPTAKVGLRVVLDAVVTLLTVRAIGPPYQAMRMIAVAAAAAGITTVNAPSELLLSAPKSSTAIALLLLLAL